MGQYKKDVTPLLMHWSYVFHALTHGNEIPFLYMLCLLQVHELEVEDDELRHQVEDLSSRLEETQASLSRSRVAEKEARAQMHEAQGQEVTIQQTYLTQLEDLRAAEAKGRRRVAELEQEKRELQDKLDEQCEQLSDLEASENACRQRLRSVESQEVELEARIMELEQAETRAKLRAVEVESQSDELAVKLQKADTDKLSLETALQLAEADSTKLQLERDQLRIEKEKLMKEKDELEVEKEQLEAEKEKLEDVQAHLEDHKEALEERVKQLDNAKTALAAALDSMEEMRDTSVEAAEKLQLENTQLQSKLAAAEASLETYKKQVSNQGTFRYDQHLSNYRYSHYEVKIVMWLFYLYSWDPHSGKVASLYCQLLGICVNIKTIKTVFYHCNMFTYSFLQIFQNTRSIACPWEWGMLFKSSYSDLCFVSVTVVMHRLILYWTVLKWQPTV